MSQAANVSHEATKHRCLICELLLVHPTNRVMSYENEQLLLCLFMFFGLSDSRICEQTDGRTKKRQNLAYCRIC
jgi:hypothetical protein